MATEVADGVFQVSVIPYVNTFAVRGDGGWTIIDAGVAQVQKGLVRRLEALGIARGDVERLLLTHGHVDHAGGAEAVRAAFGLDEVLVGAADVADTRRGVSATGATPSLASRGPDFLGAYPPVPSATALPEDPEIAIGDDRVLVAVPTPGHTDGHTAFHLPDTGVVIGGDTVFNIFWKMPSPGFLCSESARNTASIMKLAELRPSTLLLAHGTPLRGDVHGELRTLIGA